MNLAEEILADAKALVARLEGKPSVKAAEAEIEAIGTAAWAYIKANGLTDLIGIAKSALLGAAVGTSYSTILATVVKQGEAAGISIAKGAEAIVVAGAQADLIAAGQLVSPSSTTLVAAPVSPAGTAPAMTASV